MKLDPRIVGPLEAVHTEVVVQQLLRGRPVGLVVRPAENGQGAVRQEDKPPARPEESRRLGDPAIRVTPQARTVLADGEVEGACGERHLLRIAVDEWEVEPELYLVEAGVRQLGTRVIDTHYARAAPLQPRGHVPGATAELDDIKSAHLRQQAKLRFSDSPDAPGRLRLRPVAASPIFVLGSVDVPFRTVYADVVGRRTHAHISTKFAYTWRPSGPLFSGWNWVPITLRLAAAAAGECWLEAIACRGESGVNECTK